MPNTLWKAVVKPNARFEQSQEHKWYWAVDAVSIYMVAGVERSVLYAQLHTTHRSLISPYCTRFACVFALSTPNIWLYYRQKNIYRCSNDIDARRINALCKTSIPIKNIRVFLIVFYLLREWIFFGRILPLFSKSLEERFDDIAKNKNRKISLSKLRRIFFFCLRFASIIIRRKHS